MKTLRIGRTPVLSIDKRELAGQVPRQGDLVTMLDGATPRCSRSCPRARTAMHASS